MVPLLCLVTVAACSDDRDEIDARFGGETWESQHYRYRYRAGDPMACEGVLDSLETYGGLIADLLGVKGDEWTQSSVYKYPSREAFEDAEVCRSTASACTDSDSMYAAVPVAGHELVHNIMAKRTSTDISLLLAEGLANALTCDPHAAPRDAAWDFRSFKSRPDEHDVAQAGRLVLGLLRHISAPELMSLIDATHSSDSPERVRQLLLERHGVDLDDVQREVEADGTGSCVPLYACSGEPLPVGKSTLTHDCRGPLPAMMPLDYEALSVQVDDARVRFMPCDIAQSATPLAGFWPWYGFAHVFTWIQPPTTPHALWLDNAESSVEPLDAHLTLAPLAGVFTEQCSLEQPQPMAYPAQVSIVLDGRAKLAHFPFAFSAPTQLGLAWQKSTDPDLMRVPERPLSVSYCRSCVDSVAADCTVLENLDVERQWVDVSDEGVLVVAAEAPLSRVAVLTVGLRNPAE